MAIEKHPKGTRKAVDSVDGYRAKEPSPGIGEQSGSIRAFPQRGCATNTLIGILPRDGKVIEARPIAEEVKLRLNSVAVALIIGGYPAIERNAGISQRRGSKGPLSVAALGVFFRG
jgi:hypothetical protein